MLLTLEGWVRRMEVTYGGGASGQHVEDLLAEAVAWLGRMCHSHVRGVRRLHGEAQPSGAEIRMQLSAAATMLKHGGVAAKAARPFMSLILDSLRDASASLCIPHQLHFISLYVASRDWGLSSPFPCSIPLDPLSAFTENARALADTVLSLHGAIQARLFSLTPAVGLGSLALSVMTTGPVWEVFLASVRVGLHPGGRLLSSLGFDPEGYHTGTTNVICFMERASAFSLRLISATAATGPLAATGGGCLSESIVALSPGQRSSAVGSEAAAVAAEASSADRLPREQRRIILACVTAAYALLHTEALCCLVGQLWHIRVEPRLLPSSDSSGSSEQLPGASGGGTFCGLNGQGEYLVGHLVLGVFSDLRSVMGRAFDLVSRSCPLLVVEGDETGSSSAAALGRKLREISLVGLETEAAGSTPLSFFDVPTRAQAGVMEEGLRILSQMRSLATELLAMINSNPDPGDVGTSWSQWEVLQAALLRSLPPEQQEDWGRPLWCCNPGCTNLSGPSELQLKTLACGGGCGVRYCSRECQVQGWRLGHRHSCGEIVVGRG